MHSPIDRRQEILQHATELLRTRGFNAFSHRDLADRTGVKSSSIHYHFPTKQDVGLALIVQYRQDMADLLGALDCLSVPQRLQAFTSPFLEAAEQGQQWCLAGMLASDYDSLDEPLRLEVRRFFDLTEDWLAQQARLIDPGLTAVQALSRAQSAMALLEGALLLARSHQDPQRVRNALDMFHALMGVASPAKV